MPPPDLTWPQVAYALIFAVPAIIAAVGAVLAAARGKANAQQLASASRQLVTGNDKTVGEMVTEIHGEASNEGTSFPTHGPAPGPHAQGSAGE